MNYARFTNDVCGDAGLGEKWSDLLLVDAFALTLPPVWIDVDQQVFGSAGYRRQHHHYSQFPLTMCVLLSVCVCVKSYRLRRAAL